MDKQNREVPNSIIKGKFWVLNSWNKRLLRSPLAIALSILKTQVMTSLSCPKTGD